LAQHLFLVLQAARTAVLQVSQASGSERANVAVVVPLDHPSAPNLYRPGKQVQIEGMNEEPHRTIGGVLLSDAL
jgi:hypothetical protein